MENVRALGIQELTFEEQRALQGGEGIGEDLGFIIGFIGRALKHGAVSQFDHVRDFVEGFMEGYSEARSR